MDSGKDTKDVKLPTEFNIRQAETAVKALLQFASKSKDESLFMDAPVRLLMDIEAFKTPSGTDHFFNINLPHSPYSNLTEIDVLLVVPDVVDRDPDHVVGDVRDDLINSTHADKIKVREVMTFKQFRDDYATYEAKRALCKSVDAVIADRKVFKMIPGILGRDFIKKKKLPLCIPGRKFKKIDIGEQIWFVLHKTVLNLSVTGKYSTIVVGHDNLTEQEFVQNITFIVSWLCNNFPGGWQNLKKICLHIGEKNMPPLPIYFSDGTQTTVSKRPMPITRSKLRTEPVEGEISTQLGKRIKIQPTGEIRIFKSEVRDELDDIL